MGVSGDLIGLSDLVGFHGHVMGFNWLYDLYVCGLNLIHLISFKKKVRGKQSATRTAW